MNKSQKECKHEWREVAETDKTVVGEKDGYSYCIPEKLFQCKTCMRIEVSLDDLTNKP